MKKVDEAFGKTAHLLFGEKLSGIAPFVPWLERHVPLGKKLSIMGKTVYVPAYGIFKFMPDSKVAPPDAFDSVGAKKIKLEGAETIFSLGKKAGEAIRYVTHLEEGDNFDVEACIFYRNLVHGYHVFDCFDNKSAACMSWSDFNESCFGLYRTFYSKLSMNCYHSSKLTCCFEMDSCNSCGYSYFCHNCENLQDSILCFNVKNLRYAVGNVEVGREKFLQIKKGLQTLLLSELKEKKSVGRSIYSLSAPDSK